MDSTQWLTGIVVAALLVCAVVWVVTHLTPPKNPREQAEDDDEQLQKVTRPARLDEQ